MQSPVYSKHPELYPYYTHASRLQWHSHCMWACSRLGRYKQLPTPATPILPAAFHEDFRMPSISSAWVGIHLAHIWHLLGSGVNWSRYQQWTPLSGHGRQIDINGEWRLLFSRI